MAALVKKAVSSALLNNGKIGIQFVRPMSHWNKDWKPGPYPKTDAERVAAAKKYGLLPQDYEPYPDDGTGYGDYPKLTLISNDGRDPYVNWDYPDLKRNFGEPMHVDFDKYTEERISNAPTRFTRKQMLTSFLLVFGSVFTIIYIFEVNDWKLKHPLAEKHYPQPGKTHYTFEPLD